MAYKKGEEDHCDWGEYWAQKRKKGGGRPAKMTDEVLEKLKWAWAHGCTDAEACCHADISVASLHNYQHQNPKLLELKEKLKQTPFLKIRTNLVQAASVNAELGLKYLERKLKAEFAARQEVTGPEGQSIKIELQTANDIIALSHDDEDEAE